MPEPMHLTIVLRKDVPDRETGQAIFNLVKEKLADRPDIKVDGSVTNCFGGENGVD